MITKIEHIAIAVKDLNESIRTWEKLLGTECYKTEFVPGQNVDTAFFKVGETKIELVSSRDEASSLNRFIDRNGEGLHHLAFDVTDISEESRRLKDNSFRLIANEPGPGAENKQVRFVHPSSSTGVLVELCQDLRID